MTDLRAALAFAEKCEREAKASALPTYFSDADRFRVVEVSLSVFRDYLLEPLRRAALARSAPDSLCDDPELCSHPQCAPQPVPEPLTDYDRGYANGKLAGLTQGRSEALDGLYDFVFASLTINATDRHRLLTFIGERRAAKGGITRCPLRGSTGSWRQG